MVSFYDAIDELVGEASSTDDIVCTVRRCWFYDFLGEPVRIWDGQGDFTDTNGNEWLGTIDPSGRNIHQAPPLQDGRDGTSAAYQFGLQIPTMPDQEDLALYSGLKSEQAMVFGRNLTCYLALFKEGEGLLPQVPLLFYKQLTMYSPKFDESVERDGEGRVIRSYKVTIIAKDGNAGRSEVPDRTYADTMQKRRAVELGVALDRGSEFLALLANRTYQIP